MISIKRKFSAGQVDLAATGDLEEKSLLPVVRLKQDLKFNLFLFFFVRCYDIIMIFGEVLILAFLATTMGLLGVSIHSVFSSHRTNIVELRKLEDKMMEKYGWAPSVPYNPYYPPNC